ncbi:MAG: glycosyltransferase [Blautia sp.]|nr:glycosyltransferase [Blautia sp.]
MAYQSKDHVFAVCAYQESVYLEECIESLNRQTKKGQIILCTATPNAFISSVAEKYHLPLYVNRGAHGIAEDWNFAYARADAPLVTLAHQDDVYEPQYLEKVLEKLNRTKWPLIAFTDYFELRNGARVYADRNKNLRVKEIALLPLRPEVFQRSRLIRRFVLSLCCPICCPSVTYVKNHLPEGIFESHFLADLDWQAWEKISKQKGSFCYIRRPLMGHRIHPESTTTKVIGDAHNRSAEDLEMYRKFWPEPVARLLNRIYASSQEGNHLK